ncbi:MAG: prepilin-type N-terminal cleavage/methylation domain-containing protein [Planctomycetaceae bacterium]|nr:prepilin-type N-terminal cleavage/methylation domain-containing protein [Planctomycetaceae bacterium]
MKHGITLIELSMVLVIVALLVGGVVMGRDMIWAANMRSALAQIDEYKTASHAFKIKYGCLPGDCVRATTFLTGTANGDGNHRIGGPLFTSVESHLFWQHLALAGLMSGNYSTSAPAPGNQYVAGVNFPHSKIGDRGGFGVAYFGDYNHGTAIGGGWVFPAQYDNALMLGRAWSDTTSRVPLHPTLTGSEALQVDTKVDDGRPAYGKVVSWRSGNYSGTCLTSSVATSAFYNTLNSTVRCSLFFTNAF